MTNLGLEQALGDLGVDFCRAKVGDRYVLEMLKETGGQLGGETSGHLLCLDKTTTGDGLISALQVLGVVAKSGRSLADLVRPMKRYPQVLINVKTAGKIALESSPPIQDAIEQAEQRLAERGRVLVRPSGTEPVMRVMMEGEDESEIRALAEELAETIGQAASG
jgi:phosphoglucosamine mutase